MTNAPSPAVLPPNLERFVGVDAHHVALQAVALQAHQTAVGDLAAQVAVLDRRLEALVPSRQQHLAAALLQVAEVQLLVEVLGTQLAVVDELEDQSVAQDWLEDLGEV